MREHKKTKNEILLDIEDLRIRLGEAEETLGAIRRGEVDGLVVSGPKGDQVFTLKGAERSYRFFVETMNEGAVTLSFDGTILYCNDCFAKMVEMPHEKIIGGSISRFVSPSDAFASAFHKGTTSRSKTEALLKRGDNQLLPVSLSFNPMEEEEVPGVCMVATDLTERKRYEEEILKSHAELEKRVQERTAELERANDQLRRARDELEIRVQERTTELARKNVELENQIRQCKEMEGNLRQSESRLRQLSNAILNAQEKERKVVAQEIHDSIGASLAAAKFKVEATLRQVSDVDPRTAENLKGIISILQESIDEARRIQMALRPSILDDLGIVATINWFCRQYGRIYTAVQVAQEIHVEEHEVPDSLRTVIFRVLQEAMNNIAKHSKATQVFVTLQKVDQALQLAVHDNGSGFKTEDVLSRRSSGRGLGLDSMKERTELAGGAFAIESAESGTVVRASWPA